MGELKYICMLFLIVQFVGCSEASSHDICSGKDFLLDETSYPEGAKVTETVSPLPDSSRHSAGNTVDLGDGIAVQDVHPFSKPSRALQEFQLELQSPVFSSTDPDFLWQTPPEFSNLKLNADNFEVACGRDHNIPMCRFISQYGNYFVLLNVQMYSGEMNHNDLRSVLLDLDNKMLSCK